MSTNPKIDNIKIKSYADYLNEEITSIHRKDNEFLSVISLGLRPRVEKMIKTGKHNIQIKDTDGNNAIHFATKKNDPELLKMLCELGVAPSSKGFNKATPFMVAAKYGCLENLKYLKNEACVDVHSKDKFGQNALFYAVRGESLECVRYLIKDCKLNYKLCNLETGDTLLHTASRIGNLNLVKYLIKNLKLDPHLYNSECKSPLRLAVEANALEVVKYLYESEGANLFIPDDLGHSPISYSAFDPKLIEIFTYFSQVVQRKSLMQGDLMLTGSISNPPITPFQGAKLGQNYPALDIIFSKTVLKDRVQFIWTSQKSPLYQKLEKIFILQISEYF